MLPAEQPSPRVSESVALKIRTGWGSALARLAGAALLFECATGLAITFGPFQAATEWTVLVHTAVGVITLASLVWYFVRHWHDYRDRRCRMCCCWAMWA